MKTLSCKDAGVPNCDYVIRGSTDDEIFHKAFEHAKSAHGMTSLTTEMRDRLRKFIKEESAA